MEKAPTQEETAGKGKSILTKSKIVLSVKIAVISIAAFFVHMVYQSVPEDVQLSKKELINYKNENLRNLGLMKNINFDLAFGKIKNNQDFLDKQKELTLNYLAANKVMLEKKEAHQKLLASKKVFGFDNIKFFLGEIWAIGMLIYCLTNFIKEFKINRFKYKWELVRHSIYIYIAGFFSYYPFIYAPRAEDADYPTAFYLYSMLFCVLFILPTAYFFNKHLKNNNETTLIKYILHFMHNPYVEMSSTAYEHVPENEKQSVLDKVQTVEDETYDLIHKVIKSK